MLKGFLERLLILGYDNKEVYEKFYDKVKQMDYSETDYNKRAVVELLRMKLGLIEQVKLFIRN